MKRLEIYGYVKDLQSLTIPGSSDTITSSNLIHNRINFKYRFSENLTARVEIRNRLFYGEQIGQSPGFGEIINQYPGYFNLSRLWLNRDNLIIQSVIDRMLLRYSTEGWDVILGRQRINWGINNIWNPNDLFNAYNFLDFDYEERPGTDGIRIQHFLKDNSALEIAFKPGRRRDQTIGAAIYRFNRAKYDFQLLTGLFNADCVAGAGWAGNIKDAGFKGEICYFRSNNRHFEKSDVVNASCMWDYTFKNEWYAIFSFLFNSEPKNSSEGAYGMNNFNISAKNLFPFRYSFYGAVSKSFTPINTLNASIVYSPTHHTLIIFPTFSWNVANNFDLDLTLQSFFSKEEKTYKSQAMTFYLRGRWSFERRPF
jgi:hypothetical protein